MAIRYLSGVNIDSNTLVVDDANNRVGIGTASPTYTFDIVNTSSPTFRITRSGATDFRIGASILSSGALLGTYSNSPIQFLTNSTIQAVITETGNVGIGTTSPGDKLEVSGNVYANAFNSVGTLARFNSTGGIAIAGLAGNTYAYISAYSNSGGTGKNLALQKDGGNVGIGTTSPTGALHVIGSSGRSTKIYYDMFLYNTLYLTDSNYTAQGAIAATSGNLMLYSNGGTENMRITSAGNVGIGTTSPSAKLSIVGDSELASFTSSTLGASYSLLKIFNLGPGSVAWRGNVIGANIKIVSNAPAIDVNGFDSSAIVFGSDVGQGFIKFFTTNAATTGTALSERMIINPVGNVGIGTTSPVSIGTGITTLDIQGSNAGGVAFGPSGVKNYIYGASTMYVEAHTTAVFTTSGSEKMRLTTGGQLIVGGTTVGYSGTKLQVGNTSDSQNGLNILTSTTGYGYILFGDGAGADTYVGQIWYYHGDNYMGFQTNGGERMRITSAGNVGIGTTSPSSKLHVSSSGETTLIIDSTSAGTARINLTGAGGGAGAITSTVGGLYVYASGANPITFNTNGSERLRVESNGNVGIGTTSPSQKLHVNAASGAIYTRIQNDVNSLYLGLESGGIAQVSSDVSSLKVMANTFTSFETAGSERMRIFATNGVSIGKTTNAFGTSTRGSLEISGSTDSIMALYSGSTLGGYVFHGGTNMQVLNNINGGSLEFYTQGTERMRITAGGSVGIGTTSPNEKLHVAGNIHAYAAGGIDAGLFASTSAGATTIALRSNGVTHLNGGNVGIGTTSPGFKLTLAAASATDSDILLAGMTGVSNGFTVKRVSSSFVYSMIDGGLGINNAAPTQALHVTGNARVTGSFIDSNNEAGTSGQVLSSTGSGTDWVTPATTTATSLYDLLPAARVAYNWTGQVVNDTWTDVFTASDNVLTTGTWMVQMYISDFSVGGGHYTYTYTGTMQWYQAGVNQAGEAAASEIYLHRMGHAANASILYLRTTETAAAGGNIGKFQIKGNYSNTSNTTINFKFVKIF